MGLDMYLYLAKKSVKDEMDAIMKETNEENKKWGNFGESLPRKDNGWEVNEDILTEEQKTKYAEMHKVFNDLYEKEDAIRNKFIYDKKQKYGREFGYWRKFNALHGFICDRFADGVDECQEIPLTLDNVKFILSCVEDDLAYLKGKKLHYTNSNGEEVEMVFEGRIPEDADWHFIFDDNLDTNNLCLHPTQGFFFGSRDIDLWYASELLNTKKKFADLVKRMEKDENLVAWYQASW